MRRSHTIQIDREACVGCGLCGKDCPTGNLVVTEKKAKVLGQDCIMCGHCVAICPKAAVSITGFDEPPVELTVPVRLNPQELLEAVRIRRSIRQFTKAPIEREVLEQVIEAGRLTPTGGNAQEVSFLVLQEEAAVCEALAVRFFRRLKPLAVLVNPAAKRMEIDEHFFFKGAPAVIVAAARDQVDGSLAASNMALMAEACGLGVLYSGFFCMAANRYRPLRKKLGLARGERAVAALVLGASAVQYRRTAQKEPASVRWL